VTSRSGRVRKVQRSVKQCLTIPLGPSLQALHSSEEGSEAADYRRQKTRQTFAQVAQHGRVDDYEDYIDGELYRTYVTEKKLQENDIVVAFSIDGAQLLKHKQSDCWIYIWIVYDICPQKRYLRRYILPGGFIPGPNNMKFSDSFIFRGLEHVNALQKEGLSIWSPSRGRYKANIWVAFVLADGPGLAHVHGMNGTNAVFGCRLGAECRSRRREGKTNYYPACRRPDGPPVPGSDHPSWDPLDAPKPSPEHYEANVQKVLSSTTEQEYAANKTATGLGKASLFRALTYIFALPLCLTTDMMHLAGSNLPSLFITLWRGKFPGKKADPNDPPLAWPWAVLRGAVWKNPGQVIADTLHYIPALFGRAPRNPYLKINSGYKAWEFIVWVWGLIPGTLHEVLPPAIYQNFCKLVYAVRRHSNYKISKTELRAAHVAATDFHREYENLYYQGRSERLWMCRQSVHQVDHAAPVALRVGPLSLVAQWACERTIGDLGGRCQQPSQPYANFAERGLQQCRENALYNLYPDLAPDDPLKKIPRGAVDLGEGYVLLRAREGDFTSPTAVEAQAIWSYVQQLPTLRDRFQSPESILIRRWARIRLPNGQVARSLWKEHKLLKHKYRMSRQVKVRVLFVIIHIYMLTHMYSTVAHLLQATSMYTGLQKSSTTSALRVVTILRAGLPRAWLLYPTGAITTKSFGSSPSIPFGHPGIRARLQSG
jgi:hypothetical protein